MNTVVVVMVAVVAACATTRPPGTPAGKADPEPAIRVLVLSTGAAATIATTGAYRAVGGDGSILLASNRGVTAALRPARATSEQFDLFARYQVGRHDEGDMARMDFADYRTMIEVGAANSFVAEFRDSDASLVAACLVDRLGKGLSAVYSFYEPHARRRSLGSLVILWLVQEARRLGLVHVYLGYWIAESRKMSYKSSFRPLEILAREGWAKLV